MKRTLCLILPLMLLCATAAPAIGEDFPVDPPAFEQHRVSGDASLHDTREVTLSFVSTDGATISGVTRVFAGDEQQTLIEDVLNAFLTSPLNMRFRVGSPEITLLGLEEGCGVVTLDLSADYGAGLDAQERFTFMTAIANTLLGLEDVSAVNILVGGQATGTEDLPTGAFTVNTTNPAALFAQIGNESRRVATDSMHSYMRNVTVYYPAADSTLFLPKLRTKTFSNSFEDNVRALLDELFDPDALDAAFECLPDVLAAGVDRIAPSLDITEAGERLLRLECSTLDFSGPFADADRFRGAVTLTFLTCLPGIDAISFTDADGEVICRRRDYAGRVGSTVSLCFARPDERMPDGWALAHRNVAVMPLTAHSGLETLRRAADTPIFDDLVSIFPEGVHGCDILGVELIERTAVVDLSANFYARCGDLDPVRERLMIYGMIDMLTAGGNIRAVRFTFDGHTVKQLSGRLFLGTTLMPDPTLFVSEGGNP